LLSPLSVLLTLSDLSTLSTYSTVVILLTLILSMKRFMLTISIVFLGLPMLAQDIHFPPAIIAAGGSSEGGSVTLSRWRLAPIHVITLTDNKFKGKDMIRDADWSVNVYPNPVEDFLYLEFQLPEQRDFILKITDVAGRIIFIQEARTFIDGSTSEFDLSSYAPALYILQISSPDLTSQRVYQFHKY